MARHVAHSGSPSRTALGLLVLGLSSALFGALVVGPGISERLSGAVRPRSPGDSDLFRALQRSGSVHSAAGEDRETPREDPFAPPDPGQPAPDSDTLREAERELRAAVEHESHPVAPPAPGERTPSGEASPAVSVERPAPPPPKPERTASPATDSGSERPDGRRRTETARTAPRPTDAGPPRTTASETGAAPRRAPERVESPVAPPVTASTPFFRVRLGRFSSRDEADRLRSEVERTGVGEVTIVRDGDAFAVQAGAYRARENAERVAAELRSRSFQPEVSQGTPSPAGRP